MKGSVCEAFAVILSKELAVTQSDVVDLVAGATSVHPLPLLWRLLSFSAFSRGKHSQTFDGLIKPDTFLPDWYTRSLYKHEYKIRINIICKNSPSSLPTSHQTLRVTLGLLGSLVKADSLIHLSVNLSLKCPL